MLTIEDIIKSKDLEKLFHREVTGNNIINQIRNFGYLDYKDIRPYLGDKRILNELVKYGRHSIINRYKKEK